MARMKIQSLIKKLTTWEAKLGNVYVVTFDASKHGNEIGELGPMVVATKDRKVLSILVTKTSDIKNLR